MSPPSPNSDSYLFPLPQYGFGADLDFKTLLANNPFLYRVYTPKERSPFFDDSDPFLVAPQFDEVYARTPVEVTSATVLDPLDASYSEVATHMEWTTRSKSIFLSTSFSFAWSIWEAVRRYHHGMKKDVEIAIIDASAVLGRAATGVELLRKSSPEERTSQYSKWYRFSQESQSVLVHGFIPGYSVIASVPLTTILERLPSYYLRTKTHSSPGRPLDHLGWNYFDKKHNYRQFCQEITNRFFAQSQENRFRDATGGSMRLALTLLRPWFHRTITRDFKQATTTLRSLAIIIAHWGGQWWAKEHTELNRILDAMANTLGEELLQRFKRDDQEQINRLQDTVDTLEKVIRRHETKRLTQPASSVENRECCSTPITPESSPRIRPRRTLSMSISVPTRESANVQTPITPPESPAFSQIFSRNVDLEYLPSTISFQPFTPPTQWPSLPPQASPSLPIRTRTRTLSLSSTAPVLGSILSPVAEVASPTEESVAPEVLTEVQELEVPPQTPKSALKPLDEAPRTPTSIVRKLQYPPSPASTPPATLDSLRRHGLHARTLSDFSQGFGGSLRIEIPESVPRQLVFPPSPTESVDDQCMKTCLESAVRDSPAGTLAPSPMPQEPSEKPMEAHTPILSATKVKLPLSAVDPCFPAGIDEESVAEGPALPALPPSPAMSWASVSTLPIESSSRPTTPVDKIRDSFASDTTRVAPGTPVYLKENRSTSSLSSVQSRRSAAGPPKLSLGTVESQVHQKLPPPSAPVSPQTPLSDYLVTPIEGNPMRGEVRYRVPKPPVGMFRSPIDDNSSESSLESEDVMSEYRRRFGRRRRAPTKADTGAFVVTGFLVGAFVTLFLVSTQRRTVLSLT